MANSSSLIKTFPALERGRPFRFEEVMGFTEATKLRLAQLGNEKGTQLMKDCATKGPGVTVAENLAVTRLACVHYLALEIANLRHSGDMSEAEMLGLVSQYSLQIVGMAKEFEDQMKMGKGSYVKVN